MKGLALVLALLPLAASAATITVNDRADTTGGSGCTLRDAIAAANTDTAQGGCSAGSGADTIQFNFGRPSRIVLTSNTELLIETDITILGPGAGSLTIDGNSRLGGTRVFEITAGTATISDLTIKNGNAATANGGGVLIDTGATLNLSNCTLTHNVAGSGGGIFNNNGTLTLSGCRFDHNRASDLLYGSGGGIANGPAAPQGVALLNASNCTMTANVAVDGGGAISNYGSATVSSSTLNRNKVFGSGGGIATDSSATLVNCTIQRNQASDGGGAQNGPDGTLTMKNCTVSRNSSTHGRGFPGGISNAGPLALGNTIVANSARLGGDCAGSNEKITDLGHNLIDDPVANCGLNNGSNGDLVGVAAGLLRLANNGGATKTMALCTKPGGGCKAASPALNAGDNTLCQGPDVNNLDQRGFLRVTGSDPICDIGAYEAQQ